MFHQVDTVFNATSSKPIPGAQVQVYDASGVIAAIFADQSGTPIESVSGVANTAVTDGDGVYDFWVADGTYDLRFFVGQSMVRSIQKIALDGSASTAVTAKANASALGVLATDSNLGEFSGSTIPPDQTAKQALQALETAHETAVADLASPAPGKGPSLIGFKQAGIGAVPTTIFDELLHSARPEQFGAVGDDATDDTAAFQKAVDFVVESPVTRRLLLSNCVYKLTAPIVSEVPIAIRGNDCSPFYGLPPADPTGARGAGSWLHFAHGGKGLALGRAGSATTGWELEGFGTFRDQPAPASGWAPSDHDFDIFFRCADFRAANLMLLNPTRGISAIEGNFGRPTIENVRMHAFKTGVFLDKQYDVARIVDLHQWSFWSDSPFVHAYTYQNLDTLYMQRVDNPFMSRIFSIRHRSCFRIGQSADDPVNPSLPGGTVSKFKIESVDLDIGTTGLWVDDSVAASTTGMVSGFTAQGKSDSVSRAILIEGDNARIDLVGSDFADMGANAIYVSGSNNELTFSGKTRVRSFNGMNTGFPAVEADANNRIVFSSAPEILNGNGAPGFFGGGVIEAPLWRDWTPTISAAGTFGSVTVNHARYQHCDGQVEISLDYTIDSVGTATGSMSATMPVGPVGPLNIPGFKMAPSPFPLMAAKDGSVGWIDISKIDGTSAIVAGGRYYLSGSYRVA